MATPGKKGFYASWQSASQQAAIIVSASLGFALNSWLSPAQVDDWGWRIPFFIGCLIVPFVFFIRRSLQETDEFLARKHHPTPSEIYRSILANWVIVLAGMMMVIMTTVSFYLITVYTPTFGKTVLKLTAADSLIVTICVGISNFIWLPIMGALSDRIGRRPILIAFSALAFLTAYPALSWLAASPTFPKMLTVLLWLSFIYASYNGAMIVALTEVMPFDVRTSGFSLAYSLATTFGGFTAAICTWLIATTGDNASPGYWMSAAAICGLAGTFFVYRTQERPALSGASSSERVIGA
jgi:MHS family citrate/tricarballylate:H+ symporter-like MFS transporter